MGIFLTWLLVLVPPAGLLVAWLLALRKQPNPDDSAQEFVALWWASSIVPLVSAVVTDWSNVIFASRPWVILGLGLTVLPAGVSLALLFLLLRILRGGRNGSEERNSHVMGEVLARQIPLGILLLMLAGLADLFPNVVPSIFAGPVQSLGFVAVLSLCASLLYPSVLRVLCGGQHLKDHELEQRLRSLANQSGVKVRHIWITSRLLSRSNALVTGVIPGRRHVILTAKLLEQLTPEEVEAVFAHELGHIRYGDLTWYLLCSLGTIPLIYLLWHVTLGWGAGAGAAMARAVLLALMNLAAFGALSRPFEHRADLFSVRLTKNPDALVSALKKIVDPKASGTQSQRMPLLLLWMQTHPPLTERIDYIRKYA